MRKIMKLLFCLITTILLWSSYALAESGVRFVEYPEVIDLYISYENSITCGSFVYELEPGTVVTKHGVKLFDNIVGFDFMNITEVGKDLYQIDLPCAGYIEQAMDEYDIGNELAGTVYVTTTTGEESVDFIIRLHEEKWDTSRIGLPSREKNDYSYIPCNGKLYIDKPTIDGEVLPDGWINQVNYEEEYFEFVEETTDQYIFKAKKAGQTDISFDIYKTHTNLALLTTIGSYVIYHPEDAGAYRIGTDKQLPVSGFADHRQRHRNIWYEIEGIDRETFETLSISAVVYSENDQVVEIDSSSVSASKSSFFDEDNRVGHVEIAFVQTNMSSGSTNIVVELDIPGCPKHTQIIPIEVKDRSLFPDIEELDVQAAYPHIIYRGDKPIAYFSGTDAKKYNLNILINGMPIQDEVIRDVPGLYPVMLVASDVNGEKNIGAVSVIDRIHELSGLGESEEEYGSIMLNSKELLDTLGPVKVPTLILPEDTLVDTPMMLRYKVLEIGESKIAYDLHVVDWDDNEVKIPEGSIVIFPYPEDITISNAMKYLFTIVHNALKDTEIFSTLEDTIALKEAGLCITVNSFSPFEITWEEQPEVDLPQTGDNSHIALWLVLLTLAGTAILTLKRKTA